MNPPLESRIFSAYPRLTLSERRIADVVLAHQKHLASYTATELATKASVSKATAARLFKILGYANFEEARQESRNTLNWGAPLALPEPDGAATRPTTQTHLRVEIENLRLTFERLDEATVAAVTLAIAQTRRLFVIGMRGSYSLAQYARFIFQMLKSDVRLIPAGGLSFAEEALDIGTGDVVLAIAYRRRPAILPALLGLARERGAAVVLLTDLTTSDTAEFAHHVIRCSSHPPYSFDSYAPGVSVLNYLGSRLMEQLGEAAQTRISSKEELHRELDPFTQPAPRQGIALRVKGAKSPK